MARNTGYLTSKHTPESDNCFTAEYVVKAIAVYIPKITCLMFGDRVTRILCPFDKDEHAFPKVFSRLGYDVVNKHFDPETGEGKDFFTYTKDDIKELDIDYIISNQHFSQKDQVLEHCEELDVPYALLLPLPTLQSNRRFDKVFSKGNTQALIFNSRIPYSTRTQHWSEQSGNHFASIFICKGILPEPLIFSRLEVSPDSE